VQFSESSHYSPAGLAVSAALAAFGDFLSGFLLRGFSGPLLVAVRLCGTMAITGVLCAAIFKVLPDERGAAKVYGTAGSFVLIVLFGAELTAAGI